MLWDVFCRVIDNHGDAGVCWRLAADLAGRGETVRLWIDDPAPLGWMAPSGAPGVEVIHWSGAVALREPGDVVVEAFGCDPPTGFVERMAARRPPPVWINLEYLSAEAYVERSHGLPSPQMAGPARGLLKHFFYPGFTSRTGGLLREPGLAARQRAFDRAAWLAAHGCAPEPGERVASLFCYPGARVGEWIDRLSEQPTLLLLTAGHAAAQARQHLDARGRLGALRAVELPLIAQTAFDELLWACDVNAVRGEDSWVRAIWAGRPFVWQAYPQDDGAHGDKVEAFLSRFFGAATASGPVGRLFRAWNGLDRGPLALPDAADWAAACLAGRAALPAQPDLVTQLLAFVRVASEGQPGARLE